MSLASNPYLDVIRQSGRKLHMVIDSESDAVCPWSACLIVDSKLHDLDYFDDLTDAMQAIEDWCKEYVEENGL